MEKSPREKEIKTFITSDWHFHHNKEFIYRVRGFPNVKTMNLELVKRHNSLVSPEDTVYCLGDCCLGGPDFRDKNKELIESLNGNIHIILGNHDTTKKIELYQSCANVVEVAPAAILKYRKYNFFMSHYPAYTGNIEKESLHQMTLNLYGHTHQQDSNFFDDYAFMYHVGVDSHDCYPVLLDDVIEDIKEKFYN